jgi:hypothetical protein
MLYVKQCDLFKKEVPLYDNNGIVLTNSNLSTLTEGEDYLVVDDDYFTDSV